MTQRTILLVISDHSVRQSYKEQLQLEGYCTVDTADGVQALDLASRQIGIGAVLLDLRSTNMTNLEFLVRLNQVPGLQSVPTAAFSKEKLEADALFPNPSDFNAVLRFIKDWCG